MSSDPDALRDIFLDVTEEETVTESQEDDVSRDPIGDGDAQLEADISRFARDDGLEEAVDTDFGGSDIAVG